jgi:LuxR family maltose regulon positive regulatory protein
VTGETASRGGPRPVRTKITAPAFGPEALRRPAVDELLDRNARVTVVVGPAGFGKTTAVATWAAAQAVPVAWYTVDAFDARPSVFWGHLAAAVAQAGRPPATGGDADDRSDGDGDGWGTWPEPGSEVAGLLGALGPEPDPMVVVVDDLHLVEDATVLEQLAYFVQRAPAALRFVVVARVRPALPWGRWAVRGMLAELPEQVLAMGVAEAAALVRASAEGELADELVDQVVDAAAGWPAALRLAGLMLGRPGRGAPPAGFVLARDRLFFEFVADEVLAGLPTEVRDAVVLLSLLDDLDPQRCESLCGVADGAELLRGLERRGLPLAELDPLAHGYRFHALFRDVLATELARTRGSELAALHARAAQAELAAGDEPAAVRHLIAAGDLDAAFRIVFAPLGELYRTGSMQRMADWIDRFPTDFVASSAERSAAFALAMAYLGRRQDAELWSRLADDIAVEPSMRLDVSLTLPRLMLALDRGDTDVARAEVAALRARHGAEVLDRDRESQMHTVMAVASLVDERLEDADHWVGAMVRWPDTAERVRAVGQPTRAAWSAFLQGALDRSAALARDALDAGGEAGRAALHALIELYSLQAALALERFDLDEAETWTARAAELVESMHPCLHVHLVERVAVAVVEARAGVEAALTVLTASAASVASTVPPEIGRRVQLLIADLEARAGRTAAAARRLTVLPPSPRRALVAARIAALAGRPEAVETELAALPGLAVPGGAVGSGGVVGAGAVPRAVRIEAELLRARVAPGSGALARALDAGARDGYVWTFRREGPALTGAVNRAVAAGGGLQDTLLGKSLRAPARRLAEAVVELSEAEQRVLQFLPTHRSFVEIAGELYVSVNTVKTHVRGIYRKLGVSLRSDAVRRAEEFGLLDD